MSYKVYFTHNLDNKITSVRRDELSYLKITKDTFNEHSHLIEKSISIFNSELDWEEMWNINDAEVRLLNGGTLYLLLENENPLGHVWYDLYYLYNAFVSVARHGGDSAWFIQETMWDMKSEYDLTYIKLYVDDWNDRAKKFWKKLGYLLLT